MESVEIVQFLLDSGVDVNLVGDDGISSLTAAAQSGSTSIFKILLNAGAPVNVQSKASNIFLLCIS